MKIEDTSDSKKVKKKNIEQMRKIIGSELSQRSYMDG